MNNLQKDIRYKILLHLDSMGHTTEEIPVNEFLATIKTVNDKRDIGTIKRAIEELIREGYVFESVHGSKIADINTKGPVETCKNPERFIGAVKDAPKIPPIYLFITLKGRQFLIESQHIRHNFWLTKNRILLQLAFVFIGFFLAIITQWITTELQDRPDKSQFDQWYQETILKEQLEELKGKLQSQNQSETDAVNSEIVNSSPSYDGDTSNTID